MKLSEITKTQALAEIALITQGKSKFDNAEEIIYKLLMEQLEPEDFEEKYNLDFPSYIWHYEDYRIILHCVDILLDTCGVEYIQHPEGGSTVTEILAEYCNTGETYTVTVLYDCEEQEFMFVSWGDWYEQWELDNPQIPTEDEFQESLVEMLDFDYSASDLLDIPGVYEIISEHFNNDVIEWWRDSK